MLIIMIMVEMMLSQGKTAMACLSIPARVQERRRSGAGRRWLDGDGGGSCCFGDVGNADVNVVADEDDITCIFV